jgi:hypothetical protein
MHRPSRIANDPESLIPSRRGDADENAGLSEGAKGAKGAKGAEGAEGAEYSGAVIHEHLIWAHR